MKESNFYSDEFEQLIREKTEQYKMYPSENVWKGVHNSLHTKRKWFISSMAVLVTGILFFSGKELLAPSRSLSHKLAAAGPAPPIASIPIRRDRVSRKIMRTPISSASIRSGTRRRARVDQPQNHLAITISHPVVSQPDLSELLSHAVQLPGEAPSLIASASPACMNKLDNPGPHRGCWTAAVRHASENQAAHGRGCFNNSAESFRETTHNHPRDRRSYSPPKRPGMTGTPMTLFVRGVIESLTAKGRQPVHTYRRTLPATRPPVRVRSAGRIKDSAGTRKHLPTRSAKDRTFPV